MRVRQRSVVEVVQLPRLEEVCEIVRLWDDGSRAWQYRSYEIL
jgi:hypothetical protein